MTMAGGQGSRLGHEGPKGTFQVEVDKKKSIFEILCERMKEVYEKYKVYVPWYIMTSKQNSDETVEFFEKNNYFGYPKSEIFFFPQGELPVLNEEGKLMIDKEGNLNQAADGHGGVFISLRKNKMIEDMKKRNIKWMFIGPVDNILVKPIDSIFIGLCEDKNVMAGGKSIVKAYPEERVGVFCTKEGKPTVIEYTEISDEMCNETNENGELVYSEAHILCNMFKVDAIDEISKDKLPYHSAYKKIEYMDENGDIVKPQSPNAYKFEAFLFDAFELLKNMAVYRVKREEEFAPIKNAEGNDSPETAVKLYKDFYNIK